MTHGCACKHTLFHTDTHTRANAACIKSRYTNWDTVSRQMMQEKRLWKKLTIFSFKLHQSNIPKDWMRGLNFRLLFHRPALLSLYITISEVNLNLASLPPISTSDYRPGCEWHSGNIREDWRTQGWKRLSHLKTRPLKAGPLCYNKASWAKRYETRITSAS